MRRTNLLLAIAVAQLFLIGLAGPVSAADEPTFDRQTPIVKVYRDTHKAVVNIAGEHVVSTSGSRGFVWPDMFDFWVPRTQRQAVLGSGMVVHEDGYVITNAHVIEDAEKDKIKVVFSDGDEFPAKIVSTDKSRDLAVLTIAARKKLPFIRFGRSNDLMIGETVIAIGNPYGYSNTVTSGVVSAVGRDIQVDEGTWLRGLIQTDAPINPGNSGGPLLNINGDLIGVNTAIRPEAQNIGFAIPVDTLADNLRQMLMPEKLRRVRLGLVVGRMKRMGGYTGLVAESVGKGSPADKKGISAGDMILEIDGRRLTSVIDFYVKMREKKAGEPIEIKYVRPTDSRLQSRTVRLRMQTIPLPDGQMLANRFFQMDVSALTDRVARKFDFESAYPILIVTAVDSKGVAGRVGLEPGDLILDINRNHVRNITELSLELEKVNEGDLVEIKILRIRIGAFSRQYQRLYRVRLKAESRRYGRYSDV
ncbi:MAG: trypsin-like peptidase domain-containing protein [Planctomycetota bacterium]|jgi:serine protease Do